MLPPTRVFAAVLGASVTVATFGDSMNFGQGILAAAIGSLVTLLLWAVLSGWIAEWWRVHFGLKTRADGLWSVRQVSVGERQRLEVDAWPRRSLVISHINVRLMDRWLYWSTPQRPAHLSKDVGRIVGCIVEQRGDTKIQPPNLARNPRLGDWFADVVPPRPMRRRLRCHVDVVFDEVPRQKVWLGIGVEDERGRLRRGLVRLKVSRGSAE